MYKRVIVKCVHVEELERGGRRGVKFCKEEIVGLLEDAESASVVAMFAMSPLSELSALGTAGSGLLVDISVVIAEILRCKCALDSLKYCLGFRN